MLGYEWIITLPLEIDLFWTRKANLATYIFLLGRYIPLVAILSSYSSSSEVTQSVCVHSALCLNIGSLLFQRCFEVLEHGYRGMQCSQ